MNSAVRRHVASALVLAAVLLGNGVYASAQTTALFLDSQPGDYIGAGERQLITPGDVVFRASESDSLLHDVLITAETSNFSTTWRMWFFPPGGTRLAPGVYENATTAPFPPHASPQLNVSGMARGCDAYGRFQVYEIEYNEGALTRFAADFEQHCNGQSPALFGAIRFNSTRSSLVPFDGLYPVYSLTVTPPDHGFVTGPGIDCGAGRTDCGEQYSPDTLIALRPVPLPGYVFLGWAGDCVGEQDATVLITRRRFCAPVFTTASTSGLPESPDYSGGAFFLQGAIRDIEGVSPDLPTRLVYLGLPEMSPLRSVIAPAQYPLSSHEIVHLTVASGRFSAELLFGARPGSMLSPGDYLFTSPFRDPATPVPLLSGSGDAPSCAQGGRFRVHEYSFDRLPKP